MPAVIAGAGGLSILADYLTTARDVGTRCIGLAGNLCRDGGSAVGLFALSLFRWSYFVIRLLETFSRSRETLSTLFCLMASEEAKHDLLVEFRSCFVHPVPIHMSLVAARGLNV